MSITRDTGITEARRLYYLSLWPGGLHTSPGIQRMWVLLPGRHRYAVAQRTKSNGGHLSLGPTPSGRLKNLSDINEWSSLRLCLSVWGMSITRELELYLCN